MIKPLSNVLLGLSLVFLGLFLYQYDYLEIHGIAFNPWFLGFSTLALWLGFLASALAWRHSLEVHGVATPFREALVSHGLTIFAKYIPGRVWSILGRASRMAMLGPQLRVTSYASLKEQLVYIWLGLLQSLFLLLGPKRNPEILALVLVFLAGLTLFNFSGWFRGLSSFLFRRMFKRELNVPLVRGAELLSLTGHVALYSLLWGLAFWLFVRSAVPGVSPLVAFVFPFSVTLGLLSLILPGGLVVREGVMVLSLHGLGIPIVEATTIALAARLWFVSGEAMLFLLALAVGRSGGLRKRRWRRKSRGAGAPPAATA